MRTNFAPTTYLENIRALRQKISLRAIFFLNLLFLLPISDAYAQNQYASKQRQNVAVGHYARTRAMLVEALAEFEQGRKVARPDLLLDSEEFRLRLISLAEELNRVIDPKPRVSRDGVVFRASPRMIRREQDRLPSVPDGAQDSNEYGENRRLKEMQASRRKMYEEAAATERKIGIKKDEETTGKAEEELRPEAEELEGAEEDLLEQEDQKVKEAVAAELEKTGQQQGESEEEEEAEQPVIVIDTAKGLPAASPSSAEEEDEEEKEPGVIPAVVEKKKVEQLPASSEAVKAIEKEAPLPAETAAKIEEVMRESEGQAQSEVDKTSAAIEKSVEERLRLLGEKGKLEGKKEKSSEE